jgi:hypothetical protein
VGVIKSVKTSTNLLEITMIKKEVIYILTVTGLTLIPALGQAQQEINNENFQSQSTYVPGEMIRSGQLPAGYNQSASYVCDNKWDVFATGDYLYWAWNQGTVQVGTIITESTEITTDTIITDTAIFNNPGYASGFQVGMGFNMKGMDNWNIYSEYSWYKNTSNENFTGTTANPIVLASDEFRSDGICPMAHLEGTLASKVKIGFQALDFLAQRPFYFGKKLTANFSTGLRAQWMSQSFSRAAPLLINNTANIVSTDISVSAKQTSWSLGPKFALDTNWLLGYGIKMLGNIAQSALYTSYNTSSGYDYVRSNGTIVSSSSTGLHNYGSISPVTEFFLGLAWGSYFCGNGFHMDLSIGYDFNIYWNYNMVHAANSQTESNMYLHGLNMQLRFDF